MFDLHSEVSTAELSFESKTKIHVRTLLLSNAFLACWPVSPVSWPVLTFNMEGKIVS